jgi:hypothetical protein
MEQQRKKKKRLATECHKTLDFQSSREWVVTRGRPPLRALLPSGKEVKIYRARTQAISHH